METDNKSLFLELMTEHGVVWKRTEEMEEVKRKGSKKMLGEREFQMFKMLL